MGKPAISVENLGKEYRIGQSEAGNRTLREVLTDSAAAPFRRLRRRATGDSARQTASPARPDRDSFWALKDVSFRVEPGEVVGIIGRNGAGKSTLLKVLSRITEPTSGRVRVRGRIASLLEVGTGFHSELSGRENVYLNGAILGMSRREIERKFDEIVSFAEVERFIDTPVKRYSSGMYLRLAFAVAAYLEPEILIVDEVLAVGDQAFQDRCIQRMQQVGRSGRTVIFVSHNLPCLQRLCRRGVLLSAGGKIGDGPMSDVISQYVSAQSSADLGRADLRDHSGRSSGSEPLFQAITIENGDAPGVPLRAGSPMHIQLSYTADPPIARPNIGMAIREQRYGNPVCGFNNRITGWDPGTVTQRHVAVGCTIDSLALTPGRYWIDLWLGDGYRDRDEIHQAAAFEVLESDHYGTGLLPGAHLGPCMVSPVWSLFDTRPNSIGVGA